MKNLLVTRLKREPRKPTLRMSAIGKPDRQLWYEINKPDLAEELHPNAYLKFFLGDILEEVLLVMAELAGHKVEGKQQEMELVGIKGHRDAVIDGVTVDVKSASPFSFKKFKDHLTSDKDAFGYLMQIQSYIHSADEDPIVTNKGEGAFLVGNKVTGDLVLDVHPRADIPLDKIFEHKKQVVKQEEPPERCFEDEPIGKSGNRKLGTNCSYCAYKFSCWENLRGFAYASGPVYLTNVEDEPRVPEIKIGEEDSQEQEV